VRLQNEPDVMLLELGVPSEGSNKDFEVKFNIINVGGIPSAIEFVNTDFGLRLAALVPSRRQATLIDPATTVIEAVALPDQYSQIARVTEDAGAEGELALLYSPATEGMAFWALGRASGDLSKSVQQNAIALRVSEVHDVPGDEFAHLKILQGENADRFFVLDLAARQTFPMLTIERGFSVNVSQRRVRELPSDVAVDGAGCHRGVGHRASGRLTCGSRSARYRWRGGRRSSRDVARRRGAGLGRQPLLRRADAGGPVMRTLALLAAWALTPAAWAQMGPTTPKAEAPAEAGTKDATTTEPAPAPKAMESAPPNTEPQPAEDAEPAGQGAAGASSVQPAPGADPRVNPPAPAEAASDAGPIAPPKSEPRVISVSSSGNAAEQAAEPAASEPGIGTLVYAGPIGYHQDHYFLGAGLRVDLVRAPSFDIFASDDALPHFAVHLGRTITTEGALSAAGLLAWDYGTREETVRESLDAKLRVHRLGAAVDARYHLLHRLYLVGQLRVGAARLAASLSTPRYVSSHWLFDGRAALGAAFELFGKPDRTMRAPRAWFIADGGYAVTNSADLSFQREDSDGIPERAQAIPLGKLSLSGTSLHFALNLSY
jgi:hypothetical protein